ncbi:MAG: tRNA (N(6)-L-threonylcarbamoyladenosine(37)-C(2))-methylthiotransferase MtaB [Parachlamydiales bacterium]|nr:tRNA (N(6)-L-threonylcarbamoyladenosine(37)-C(2))-methylthiotransferase MtaB [Parachlamydiales bacterium]
MKKKFYIATLGCKVNQYESEAMGQQLEKAGYVFADTQADLCIVNTCSVTASASRRSRSLVRSLLKNYPKAIIAVTGCDGYAKDSYAADSRVRVIVNEQKEDLVELVTGNKAPFIIENFSGHTRAFIKIQDGCNDFCSYCIIPHVRGRSRSRKLEDVIGEIRCIVAKGYKEIVLTGINLGKFCDKGKKLQDLIEALEDIPELHRIRLSSINPEDITDELLRSFQASTKICPSFHVVLQSGSNEILKKMRRRYSTELFLEKISRLRSIFSDATFTTDIIVGFPGEKQSDFEKTLELIEKVLFIKVHVFPFSVRQGTMAYHFTDKISSEVILERKKILLQRAQRAANRKKESFLGSMTSLLVEGVRKKGYIYGHTPHYFEVALQAQGTILPNTLCKVQLEKITPKGFSGRFV